MTKAESIDMTRALAVFDDGNAHTAKDVALACQVHTRTAAWFLCKMAERGKVYRLPPRPVLGVRTNWAAAPDFAEFRRTSNA